MHDESVGSVMHPLSVVTSVLRAGTVETIPGMEDDPLYVPVHPEAVGSLRHVLTVVISGVKEPSWAGIEAVVLKQKVLSNKSFIRPNPSAVLKLIFGVEFIDFIIDQEL